MVTKKSTNKKVTKKRKVFSIFGNISIGRGKKKKTTKIIHKKKVTSLDISRKTKEGGIIKLVKPEYNPIISPSYYSWETRATFNPAAVESNGKIHLLYRAIGEDDSSSLGYASTYDGFRIEERPTYSAYKRYYNYVEYNNPSIDYVSGGGWSGGCEDPRLTLIDDTLYMMYTAFDGWGSVRIALTSINFNDFKKKRWNWGKPILLSPAGEVHKNWVLFPEKINGKFAILHSITPDILVDYFDTFDQFNKEKFIKSKYNSSPKWENSWDNIVRGVGPTPIKTKLGWLVLYHAMDRNDPNRYKLGAMILDYKNPTKILYKLHNPILEPEEDYENNGNKWGVIYSCGAVVKNEELFVYYGGSDKYVCVASMSLDELLDDMTQSKPAKLKNKKKIKSVK